MYQMGQCFIKEVLSNQWNKAMWYSISQIVQHLCQHFKCEFE